MNHAAASRTIIVEARKDPAPALMLDALADTCRDLGHTVVRWRGPLSGRLPYSRWLPACDLAILYNGSHRLYRPALARLAAFGAATLFVELGWHPQAGHYQIDPQGVNVAASWCRQPLRATNATPLALRSGGDLLVLLQLNEDTQITENSPWFADMESFTRHIAAHSNMPVRVRPHPLDRTNALLREVVATVGAQWDPAVSLRESLQQASAVACINSSAAVEAMDLGLPVLCYGEAIYRQQGAVYCLTNQPAETSEITAQLRGGVCTLRRESVSEMVQRIQLQQWKPAEVPTRLPPLINHLLMHVQPLAVSTDMHACWKQACQWFADLPARVLYRQRYAPTRKRGQAINNTFPTL